MKKLIFFILLLPVTVFAQVENNNWYYGMYAGITFNTSPPSVLLNNTAENQFANGVALLNNKVSGEFQFVTNGREVWDKNFAVMPNSNTLDNIGNNSAIVVPSIANRNQYYTFSTYNFDGPSTWKGFVYSVIDMTLNSNLGDVVPTQKNVTVLDETGQPFPVFVYTRSLTVTVTPNNVGNAYWVLYPNRNKLYAYKIDINGFNPVPVVSNLNFTNDLNDAQMYYADSKISPDNTKIAIAVYGHNVFNQPNAQTRVYNFNSQTGTVSTSGAVAISVNAQNLEFSPNSNLLFYNSYLQQSQSSPNYTSQILCYDLVNNVWQQLVLGNNVFYGNLQRTPRNEIYFNRSGQNYSISKLTNPNNYNTTITVDFINMNPDYPTPMRYSNLLFPDLIPKLDCAFYEELKGNNITAGYTYQVSDHITTRDYTVNATQNISQFAGKYIELKPNTHLKNGAAFWGKIQACPSVSSKSLATNTDGNAPDGSKMPAQKLLVYPNPASNLITVTGNHAMLSGITITSATDGKLMYKGSTELLRAFEIDISGYTKGVYIVTARTPDGTVLTGKAIKK